MKITLFILLVLNLFCYSSDMFTYYRENNFTVDSWGLANSHKIFSSYSTQETVLHAMLILGLSNHNPNIFDQFICGHKEDLLENLFTTNNKKILLEQNKRENSFMVEKKSFLSPIKHLDQHKYIAENLVFAQGFPTFSQKYSAIEFLLRPRPSINFTTGNMFVANALLQERESSKISLNDQLARIFLEKHC